MITYIYEVVAIDKNNMPIGDALYAEESTIAKCLAEEMGRVYKTSEKVVIYEWPLQ